MCVCVCESVCVCEGGFVCVVQLYLPEIAKMVSWDESNAFFFLLQRKASRMSWDSVHLPVKGSNVSGNCAQVCQISRVIGNM